MGVVSGRTIMRKSVRTRSKEIQGMLCIVPRTLDLEKVQLNAAHRRTCNEDWMSQVFFYNVLNLLAGRKRSSDLAETQVRGLGMPLKINVNSIEVLPSVNFQTCGGLSAFAPKRSWQA